MSIYLSEVVFHEDGQTIDSFQSKIGGSHSAPVSLRSENIFLDFGALIKLNKETQNVVFASLSKEAFMQSYYNLNGVSLGLSSDVKKLGSSLTTDGTSVDYDIELYPNGLLKRFNIVKAI